MAYIYLQSLQQKNEESRRKLFVHFEDYSNLAMWKVRLQYLGLQKLKRKVALSGNPGLLKGLQCLQILIIQVLF